MKDMTGKLLAVLGISMFVGASALAQPYPNETWTIDENGPALLQGPSLAGYSVGTNKLDPVSGIVGWYYYLGASNAAGDVLLMEPPSPNSGTNISDLLRFDGKGGVYFFSDLEPGDANPDHADVPTIPPAINPVSLIEVGAEGNNGALYKPLPGQPGFDTSGLLPGLSYNFISDALVPEPQVALLAAVGGGLLLAMRGRRRRV